MISALEKNAIFDLKEKKKNSYKGLSVDWRSSNKFTEVPGWDLLYQYFCKIHLNKK